MTFENVLLFLTPREFLSLVPYQVKGCEISKIKEWILRNKFTMPMDFLDMAFALLGLGNFLMALVH